MTQKKCSKCQDWKPTSDFFFNKRQSDGLSVQCKKCHTTYIVARRNTPEGRENSNRWAREERAAKKVDPSLKRRTDAPSPEEMDANRESVLTRLRNRMRRYRKTNPEQVRDADLKKRGKRRGAEGSFTEAEFQELCKHYGNICLRCRQSKTLTPDHVIPLSRGGRNSIDNIQPLCLACNIWKNAKTIDYRI